MLRSLPLLALATLAACRGASDPADSPPLLDLRDGSAYDAAGRLALLDREPQHFADLHQVLFLSDDVVSGGEPQSEAAFERIASWGVKTIVSVDGKVPDDEAAARHGLRTVHVPIQYQGLTEDELLRLTKTFRELEGPFFVHCYHGKHRGPTAAAWARLVRDGIPRERALAEMRQWCGTSEKYEGLYATIASAGMPSEGETTSHAFDFSPRHRFTGFRASMVATARAWDHLKDAKTRDWKADPRHPDVDALQEATQLHALLRDAKATSDALPYAKEAEFRRWMRESVEASSALADALSSSPADAAAAFDRVATSCSACHATYRNR